MTLQYKIDQSGDIALVRGNFVLVDDLAQRLTTRLRMLRGEWFLDLSKGTPYLQNILIKNPNMAHVRSDLRDIVINTEGVRSIARFDLDFDFVRRKLSLSMVVVGPRGNVTVTL